MTTIRKTVIRLSGLSLIAVLMMANPINLAAKELCWEECTFEMVGSCWRWKKACLNLSEAREASTEHGDSSSRAPNRTQIPSHLDSLLSGGGLSTALDTDDNDDAAQPKTFGNLDVGSLLH
jgi:hypothetical protein